MSSTPRAEQSYVAAPASTWIAWWVGTWLAGVVAGSLVVGVLFAPSRPDDADGPGSVLAAPIGVIGLSLVVMWSVYLAGTWSASTRLGTGSFADDHGLRFAPVDLLGLPVGVLCQVVLVRVLYLPLRSVWPDTFSDARLEDTARDLVDRAGGASLGLLFLLVVVGAPVVEEIVYRGFLQRCLLRAAGSRDRELLAVVGVAAVFAAVHFRPVEFVGLFAFGLVLGALAWRTGRIGMAIAAHVGFNATGLVMVL